MTEKMVPTSLRSPSVAVVGGGITGLAAAHALMSADASPRVTILEASEHLGGKVRTGTLAGMPMEEGPDAFLARVPDAVGLCRDVGLGNDLVAPRTSRAYFWSRGRLRPIPSETVLGVPAGLPSIAASGVLSPEGLARASLDLVLPRTPFGEDVPVGELVTQRFGREVFERLVDPLLGGVYAGDSHWLSATATLPEVMSYARTRRSLMRALRDHRSRAGGRGPVFMTVRGGLGRLVERLRDELARCDVRTGVRVETIERGRRGFMLRTPEGVPLAADAVIVATPAFAAAALLRELSDVVEAELDGIDYVSVATVSLAYRRGSVQRPLDGSGFLVPRAEGRMIVGCTWMSSKWDHLAGGDHVLIRCAVGRAGDVRWMDLADDELAGAVDAELVEALGLREAPVETRVTRWERSMPQYVVGHPARLRRIDAALGALPGIEIAGAGYRGIGLPACIAQGRAAAQRVLAFLGSDG